VSASPAAVAVIVVRDARLPVGADEAVAEAGGTAIVVGTGSEAGARALAGAVRAWWAETDDGFRPASLVSRLVPAVDDVPLVILPSSADGRDLAPRLAAALGRPLMARAIGARYHRATTTAGTMGQGRVSATVARLDDRVLLPVDVDGPAVVTLVPGTRTVPPRGADTVIAPLPEWEVTVGSFPDRLDRRLDPEVTALLEPDPHTMDLTEATRVMAGGAGLVAGADQHRAIQIFDLLVEVAGALGASAGATRVATDAGWIGYERQIGTTGVTIDPDLYLALGISGATQHVGGLGNPRHIISVNTDASCPMTALSDLGLVADAQAVLIELGRRVGVADGHPAPDQGERGQRDVESGGAATPGRDTVRRG
jgi:electron transfer flavoprotein alpha subunit